MTPEDWTTLHDWLYGVFPEAEAAELYQDHIADARANGLELPEDVKA